MNVTRIHPTAEVSAQAEVGEGTQVWHEAQIREGACVGRHCIIGKGVFIDFDVIIGDRCKLQNGVCVYHGATLANGVFLGPRVILLNDKNPRAVSPEYALEDLGSCDRKGKRAEAVAGPLKTNDDWQVGFTHIGEGASVGGGAIILPGVTVGRWAMVGAGAVVTKDVPDYGLLYGNPGRLHGYVCPCGQRLEHAVMVEALHSSNSRKADTVELWCRDCELIVLVRIGLNMGLDGLRP